ncbi:Reticulocyte-binding protein 2-like protein a [Phytophthora ramorum]|nr:Reticulocyte-binding protein 2-like protein a [Phytophthora ramorum]
MVSLGRGSRIGELALVGCEEDDEEITLSNFDETDTTADPILTSPRSIEACRMLGVEPEELVQRPLEYFVRSSERGRSENHKFVAKRAARYEKNRQVQLRNVRAQRQELIEAQLRGIRGSMSLRTRSYCRSPVGAARLGFPGTTYSCCSSQNDFSMIEREKRELERIQQRQALEMQQMLNFELKMSDLHQEREKKEREQKRREELFAKERTRKQREADEQRRQQEIERAEQHRLDLELARKRAEEQQKEIMRREQRVKQEEARRQRDAQLSEKERLRHQEEARMQNELYQLAQEREATRKLREMQAREEKLTEERERHRKAKARELEEKQARNTERIALVLQEKDLQRRAQLEEAARKHQQSEERRQAFEEERRAKEEEVRLQAQRKKEAIEGVQIQLASNEAQRRERLREQERQAQLRLMQREREKQQQLEAQQREERRLERERRRAYERMESQLQKKQSAILRKTEEKAAVAQMMQKQKYASVRARLLDAKLREEEIQTALMRKSKQDEYRTNLLLSRIENDNERTQHLKQHRTDLIRRRQQIKQTANRQKHEILESFYKMKVTKRYELPKHLAASIAVERPRSSSATMLHSRSFTAVDDSFASTSRMTDRVPRTSRRPISATARRPRSAGPISSRRPTTSREYRSPTDNDQYDRPNSADDVGHQDDMNDEKRGAAINELRRQQNEELLKVLEEEHHAEEQREHLLRQASADRRERVRMEQMFDKERALASERIMQLTNRHERALAAEMDELDVR